MSELNNLNEPPQPPPEQLEVFNEIASLVEPRVRVKMLQGLRQAWDLGYLTGVNDTYDRVQVMMREAWDDHE